ncbi:MULTISPECIES: zf-HC2 domain-containing protein [unclassified Streptomyces]|uniref:zf-HC2 domain-containing protein n=1 Tax=unclassified Streptomyces TaxID=2593676 RepID=UPI00225BC102|nr:MULTISPECIES: zf-HC2 domain-containing protein [unclassified Streptomyces]MCX4648676.1 zf-HC2 domain-containing protein [Streptomyces sp. NBC_01446]MCX5323207.1 zf-HC2 domain-containing protein [Streptomyces sp. NBC_00120]
MFSTLECNTIRERLADYTLGALAEDEARAVTTHLATCSTCRDEHYCLAAVSAHLIPLRKALADEPRRRELGRRRPARTRHLTLAHWANCKVLAAMG